MVGQGVEVIGFLRGTLLEKTPDALLLDVGGVGYELVVPVSSLCALPPEGEAAHLYIHTHVREDAIKLFGFASLFDRKVFEALISVTGVGPRLAVGLLGPLDGVELCEAVVEGRAPLLVSIPGVGAKTAERLVLELKDKFTKLLALQHLYSGAMANDRSETRFDRRAVAGAAGAAGAAKETDPAVLFDEGEAAEGATAGASRGGKAREARTLEARLAARRVVEDLRSALENMGYKEKVVEAAVKEPEARLARGETVVFETALRSILGKLSGHLFKEKESD